MPINIHPAAITRSSDPLNPILPIHITSSQSETPQKISKSHLAHLQCSEFGILPALASHSLLFKTLSANTWTNVPPILNLIFWFIAIAGGTVALVAYWLKIWKYPKVVKWEMLHPLRHNDYYLILIGLFLMVLAYPSHYFGQPTLEPIWWILTAMQLGLSAYVYGERLHQVDEIGGNQYGYRNVYPSYLFTLVGWFLSTSLGADANQNELSLWVFLIGSFYWILLYVSLYQNLGRARASMYHTKTGPLLFLIMAPSAVATIAWSKVQGGFKGDGSDGTDNFGLIGRFYFFNSIAAVVLVLRTSRSLLASRSAALPWWASVFPTVAVAMAWIEYYKVIHTPVVRGFTWLFCAIAWVVLVFTIVRIGTATVTGTLVADPVLDKELEYVEAQAGGGSSGETVGAGGNGEEVREEEGSGPHREPL
ncbi:hypothetical protein HK097_008845 [Rhizophlyctis rosea]|uniref:Uncharacterized protein n=1 Tax=Rhizophlyctis rosea TaxID=64517 RepID=A0AAD5S9Q1_9FUNG|nr:hypothetical protein HK097_008845 [Rhizophlyctis rosea]